MESIRLVLMRRENVMDAGFSGEAETEGGLGACRLYREAVTDLSPGLQPISAKIIVIAQLLIVPEGRHESSLARSARNGVKRSVRPGGTG